MIHSEKKKHAFFFFVCLLFLGTHTGCFDKREGTQFASIQVKKSRLTAQPSPTTQTNHKHSRQCYSDKNRAHQVSQRFSKPGKAITPSYTKRPRPPGMTPGEKQKYKALALKKRASRKRSSTNTSHSAHFFAMRRNKQQQYLNEYSKLRLKYKNDPERLKKEGLALKERMLK